MRSWSCIHHWHHCCDNPPPHPRLLGFASVQSMPSRILWVIHRVCGWVTLKGSSVKNRAVHARPNVWGARQTLKLSLANVTINKNWRALFDLWHFLLPLQIATPRGQCPLEESWITIYGQNQTAVKNWPLSIRVFSPHMCSQKLDWKQNHRAECKHEVPKPSLPKREREREITGIFCWHNPTSNL